MFESWKIIYQVWKTVFTVYPNTLGLIFPSIFMYITLDNVSLSNHSRIYIVYEQFVLGLCEKEITRK